MTAIKPVTFHWQGIIRNLDKIVLIETASTFRMSEEQRSTAKKFWEEEQARNPGKYWNGLLWRYESLSAENQLEISVSPVMYHSYHYKQEMLTMRKDFLFPNPNPLGVTALQITADGYVLAGVQEFAGRNILTLIGSGFVERGRKDTVRDTLIRELAEETAYPKGFVPELEKAVAKEAAAISVMTGKGLHTTGICIYVPLMLPSTEAGIGSNEHTEYVPIPLQQANDVLNTGRYKNIPAAQQLLGALETYITFRDLIRGFTAAR